MIQAGPKRLNHRGRKPSPQIGFLYEKNNLFALIYASAFVRWAIDAFDCPEEFIKAELLALASSRVKETIADPRTTRQRLEATLHEMMMRRNL